MVYARKSLKVWTNDLVLLSWLSLIGNCLLLKRNTIHKNDKPMYHFQLKHYKRSQYTKNTPYKISDENELTNVLFGAPTKRVSVKPQSKKD